MAKSAKRLAAVVHPNQLNLFGGPQTTPYATPDSVGRTIPSPGQATSPGAAEQRTPAVPVAGTTATTSKGLARVSETPDDPARSVHPLADPVDASPCTALPSCQQTMAEEAHGPGSDAEEGDGNHTACLWRGASTYSPPETCHLHEGEIGVPLTQLLDIYALLRAFVADEQPSSGPRRRRGDGPGTAT